MRSLNFGSQNFEQKQVLITEITNGQAYCIDKFANLYVVPMNVQLSKAPGPEVGETWMIEKALGLQWTFSAVLGYTPPQADIPHAIEVDNPVFWWQLNDAAGSGFLADSGFGDFGIIPGLNHGLPQGDPITLGGLPLPVGWYNTVAALDGNSFISTSHTRSVDVQFSIEIWMQTTNSATGYYLIENTNSQVGTPASRYCSLLIAGGQPTFHSASNAMTTSGLVVNDGNWHQIVGVQASNGMALYVDGVNQVSITISTPSASTAGYWRIGDLVSGFTGNLAQAAYFNYPLTRDRIAAHYAGLLQSN